MIPPPEPVGRDDRPALPVGVVREARGAVRGAQQVPERQVARPVGGARGPLVVVAGLPGAGKSTALVEVAARAGQGVVVLDSASVREWLRARLRPVPYPVLRPFVHTFYWLRILVLVVAERRPLVIHETATRPIARWVLHLLARSGRRPARLVWIDVPAEVALRGQAARRRVIRPRAFVRHVRHVERVHPLAAAGGTWDAVRRTGREGAPEAILAACAASPEPPA